MDAACPRQPVAVKSFLFPVCTVDVVFCMFRKKKRTTSHTTICYHACAFGTRLRCAQCTSDPSDPAEVCSDKLSFPGAFPELVRCIMYFFLCYHVCRGEIRGGVGGGASGVLRRCSGQITSLPPLTLLPPLALICRKRILRAWISGPGGSCTRQRAPKLRSICLLWILVLLQNLPARG